MPDCIHCPTPEYTDQARAAKFQGTVKFDAVIDEKGNAVRLAVVKGDRHGLTPQAMKAIKSWKFKAATKNGDIVTVCVVIEVTLRLY
jgi:periplasmic protein TonB